MKRILSAIRRAPKLSGLLAALGAAIAIPAVMLAWGPERPTFTVANPATYVTFNSMTDNPVVGDERLFVSAKDAANTQAGGWQDTVSVEPGKEYLVRVYVHNNAAANLNLEAINTRVMAAIGTNTGKKVSLTGYVSADNAQPQRVYDDVHFTAGNDFNLAYVPGSAMLYNNKTGQAGRAVSDSIVNGSGAQIGYESNNGKVPGCFEYVSYVTFKVKPQFAETVDFTTEKSVRAKGETQWRNSMESKPGDTIQYRVLFQNVSNVQLDDVTLKDELPAGVSYINGSTRLYLASDPSNARVMPDGITTGGLNIGSYARNGLASVIFDAKIAKASDLECGKSNLRNVASAHTKYGSKSDDATVVITKECQEPEPETEMVKVCDLDNMTVRTISKEEYEANTERYTTELAKCEKEEKPEEGDAIVCNPETGKLITVKESERGKYLPKDSEECKEKPVVEGEVTELPQTGFANVLTGIMGLGALTTAGYYYLASRRQ